MPKPNLTHSILYGTRNLLGVLGVISLSSTRHWIEWSHVELTRWYEGSCSTLLYNIFRYNKMYFLKRNGNCFCYTATTSRRVGATWCGLTREVHKIPTDTNAFFSLSLDFDTREMSFFQIVTVGQNISNRTAMIKMLTAAHPLATAHCIYISYSLCQNRDTQKPEWQGSQGNIHYWLQILEKQDGPGGAAFCLVFGVSTSV